MELRFLEKDAGPFGKTKVLQFRATSDLVWEDVPTVTNGIEVSKRGVSEMNLGEREKNCEQCGLKYKKRQTQKFVWTVLGTR